MPHKDTFTWDSIITALTKSGFLDEAFKLFNSMPHPDQCSWNSMVSAFAQHDHFEEALDSFVRMHREDFLLNGYSYSSALSAGLVDMKMGIQIHGSMS
ncbi:hypothetical protein IFM89_039046 [Coptis chinensis]|uniref:Pentatricopeptide repeat-containing protein n=1 Tax=Coptis chinensis TaxID=261450 RepID=A0A835HED2_9MAGN|nr:hypothetical protein IFM89_039046 [Coptis chinensis]